MTLQRTAFTIIAIYFLFLTHMCNNDNIQIFKLLLPKMQHSSAHFKVTSESVLLFLISSKIFCGENYISETETAHGDRLKDNPKCTLFIQQRGISTHTHQPTCGNMSFLVLCRSFLHFSRFVRSIPSN